MPDLSPVFFIGNIRIGSVSGASCVNLGNNLPLGFQSYSKQNQGFGSITGDNNDISELCSALKDTNTIDMLNQSDTIEVPDCVKKLISDNLPKEKREDEKRRKHK
jgi:hypothetical protein